MRRLIFNWKAITIHTLATRGGGGVLAVVIDSVKH